MMKQLLIVVIAFSLSISIQAQEKAKIDSLNAISIQNSSISSDSLLLLMERNLKDAEQISYADGIAGAYNQIALIQAYRGDKDLSMETHLKAIRFYEKSGNLEKVADGYGELGYKLKRDNLEQAQKYMVRGRNIAEKHDFRFVLSRTYNNYGVLKEMQGQLDSAELYYRKGLKIVLDDDYKIGIPYSYSNLAGVFGLQKKYDSARYYFKEAQNIRREINDRKGIAENYTQIGEVFLEENKPEEAIQNFKKSVPLALEEDYNFLAQYTFQKLSDAYKLQNKTDSALYYLEKHNTFKDSLNTIEVQNKIAQLNVEFETEQKENEILTQRAQLVENELRIKNRNFTIFGFVGLLILLGLLGYLIFKRQRMEAQQIAKEKELEIALAKLETRDKLEQQRLRISRDLHDNIGSQLTFITSSLDNLKYRLYRDGNPDLSSRIDEIGVFTRLIINELRDTVWAMNKEHIHLGELHSRIADLITNAREMNPNIQYNFNNDLNNTGIQFSALEGVNLYRMIQEALNNATKYSGSEEIDISINQHPNHIEFKVTDYGGGFDPKTVVRGNGLYNMEKRAGEAEAELFVTSNAELTEVRIEKSTK